MREDKQIENERDRDRERARAVLYVQRKSRATERARICLDLYLPNLPNPHHLPRITAVMCTSCPPELSALPDPPDPSFSPLYVVDCVHTLGIGPVYAARLRRLGLLLRVPAPPRQPHFIADFGFCHPLGQLRPGSTIALFN